MSVWLTRRFVDAAAVFDSLTMLAPYWASAFRGLNVNYRVVDVRSGFIDPLPHEVHAESPEDAAYLVTGLLLSRSGRTRDLAARVYEVNAGSRPKLTRLYLPSDRD